MIKIILSLFSFSVFGNKFENSIFELYSKIGRQHQVEFHSTYRSDYNNVNDVLILDDLKKKSIISNKIEPIISYLFGPLTYRSIGGPQRGHQIHVDFSNAELKNGKVEIPYKYSGVWMMHSKFSKLKNISIPIPFNASLLVTSNWKMCTDTDPEHQTIGYYWYYWDPSRRGCNHQENQEYKLVKVDILNMTDNTEETFPEYEKLLQSRGLEKNFSLTFAFGYINDQDTYDPENDLDGGMNEYRKFKTFIEKYYKKYGENVTSNPILAGDYLKNGDLNSKIGIKFEGDFKNIKVTVKVVASGAVDQIDLFAKSFAFDHDSFFSWMGHSRVGSGFDAQQFSYILKNNSTTYNVTNNYQIVYWGGCNSYSYYTLPFFEFKSKASLGSDLTGTKGLDIISNTLPSYFSYNARNSMIIFEHLMNWEDKPSYQKIINDLESASGNNVLINVLGDEDNN